METTLHLKAIVPDLPNPLPAYGGENIAVNSRYLLRNGKPWLPVSGELHYSRLPRELWEKALDKMKEAGIRIISTYVFWIHHEEIKGEFTFAGNRNLGEFIDLCHERGLEVALRAGPWAHGECRNGGHPDWIVRECGPGARHNTEPYLTYVRQYYSRLAQHLENRRLFSIQIENELANDEEHLRTLAIMARECGLKAPIYTATGWGYDTHRLSDLVLPTYGGYPEQPWNQSTGPSDPNPNFFFTGIRCDGLIGNDLLPAGDTPEDTSMPYFTCETGPGIQCTYHRRPFITPEDALSNALCTLGNGCNWLGYYMFCGGTNPMGKLTTMNEDKASGYPNDCPVFSYDFQAPIGEGLRLRESYFRLKALHEFLADFGGDLAPMVPILPVPRPQGVTDMETPRVALRSNGQWGFVFINNSHHMQTLPEHRNLTLTIEFTRDTLTVPIPQIPTGACFLFPVRMPLAEGLVLDYALAQPVSKTDGVYLFEEIDGVPPVFRFSNGLTMEISGEKSVGGVTIQVRKRDPLPQEEKFLLVVQKEEENRWNLSSIPEEAGRIDLSYYGNTISVLADDIAIADQFYYGDSFSFYKPRGVTKLDLVVRPLTPEDDIYLECPRKYGAGIEKAEFIPFA